MTGLLMTGITGNYTKFLNFSSSLIMEMVKIKLIPYFDIFKIEDEHY